MESNPPTTRKFFLWGSLLVILWSVYLIFFARRPPSAHFEQGEPAVYDVVFEDLEGKRLSLDKYRNKNVFLHFWATWCPPCVEEMPLIEELAKNPQLSKVEFLCVSLDDKLEDVRAFVAQHNVKLPVVRSVGELPEIYRTEPPSIPLTYFINSEGRAMKRRVGSQQWNDPALLKEIEFAMRLKPEKGADPKPLEPAPAADAAAK
ncbi:MAG TPA: TlpA disulfide reductase family protein [Isosphaeraceae bacterium]|jgi:thiol-disulfide isomerase/thioredoxin|nr:TlpA disulfide reductase family protein [Isosphaeraceae bacterium]